MKRKRSWKLSDLPPVPPSFTPPEVAGGLTVEAPCCGFRYLIMCWQSEPGGMLCALWTCPCGNRFRAQLFPRPELALTISRWIGDWRGGVWSLLGGLSLPAPDKLSAGPQPSEWAQQQWKERNRR